MNKTILLNKRPHGEPILNGFKFISDEAPIFKDGELLLKTDYVSVDPYLRGRMNDAKSYVPPFELNKPIKSGIIAEVMDSEQADFKKGDFDSGILDWTEYQTSNGKGLTKVDCSPSSSLKVLRCAVSSSAILGKNFRQQPKN